MSVSRLFPAGFDSECAGCDCAILEGELIAMSDGEALCEDCAREQRDDERVTFPI